MVCLGLGGWPDLSGDNPGHCRCIDRPASDAAESAVAGILCYKRYIQGLPTSETIALTWLLGLSIGGYWALRLYLSGILLVLSFRKLLVIYLVAVALIVIPTYLIRVLPASEPRSTQGVSRI